MKLIRDKIGYRIQKENGHRGLLCAPEARQEGLLDDKLSEEVAELRESEFCDIEEYADVLEVLLALAKKNGYTPQDIEKARQEKLERNGGFSEFFVYQTS